MQDDEFEVRYVRTDEQGIFVKCWGWIYRPNQSPSRYTDHEIVLINGDTAAEYVTVWDSPERTSEIWRRSGHARKQKEV